MSWISRLHVCVEIDNHGLDSETCYAYPCSNVITLENAVLAADISLLSHPY